MRQSPDYSYILAKEMRFDVIIAKVSLVLDMLSHLLVVFINPAQEVLFIVASLMTSLGGGAYPSLQSLALCLNQMQKEKAGPGEVLGAISFLMALGSWIIAVSDSAFQL
jgi:hypothetical protein